jgi:hypothetical protein
MKKLSKAQEAERQRLADELRAAEESVKEGITQFNAAMEMAMEDLTMALDSYHDAVTEANAFRQQIEGDISGYYEDKAEKWQDSEAGQANLNWRDQWRERLEDIEVTIPDPIEEPAFTAAECLIEGLDAAPIG